MNKIVLLNWPKGGNVETAAKLIAKEYDEVKLLPLNEANENTLLHHSKFIVGGSTLGAETWEGTKAENPWKAFFTLLRKTDISKKKVALFGLGDQVLWPANFVDGLSNLHLVFAEGNAKIVGKWSAKGYDFTDSKAEKDGYFVGLALDHDYQGELTEGRIKAWVNQIKKEF